MKKTLLFFVGVLVSISSYSQSVLHVFEDWSTTAGTQNFFHKNVTKTDASKNVYVAGATLNGSGNYDILLAKYNSSGVQQWIVQYNGVGNNQDAAIGLYVDGSSNVYITGVVTTATNVDMVTIKYNSSGTQQWLSTYNGTGSIYDCGSDLVVDASGNVYATGSSYNASGNTDYVTIKYNSSGTQQWATLYDYTTNLNDAPVKIAHKASTGVVTVSGAVQASSTVYKVAVLSYNDTTGAQTAVALSSGGSSGVEQVLDMVVDASGDIYIAGGIPISGQGYNTYVVKLNSSLIIQWESTYNGADSLDDIAHGIKVDASGNVFIAGYTTSSTQGKDILTIKYNSSGVQQWVKTHNDTLDGDDVGNAIVLDASSNAYVTGYDSTAINGTDYYTIKYNSSGTEIWNIRDDGNAHRTDKASNIAIDTNGDIIVTGASQKADGSLEYKTVKYVEKNIVIPTDFLDETSQSSFLYYENKGQLINIDTSYIPQVRYYTYSTYPAYYIMNDTLSMMFYRIDTVVANNDTLQRIDVTFPGAQSPKVFPLEQRQEYMNYFLAHCPNPITEVFGNQKLVVPEIWNNIDMIYASNQNGFKCYFIVKPGGDPTNIKLKYSGASSINLNVGTQDLVIRTGFDSIVFDHPFFYQLDNTNDTIANSDGFADWDNLGSNIYGLDTSTFSYSLSDILVVEIDQGNAPFVTAVSANENMEWSTFFGTSLFDVATDVVSNAANSVWTTGVAQSPTFLEQAGTIVQPYIGMQDAFVAKFNSLARNQWIAFWGGSSDDYGAAIAIDKVENTYIVGTTKSTNLPNLSSAGINYATLSGISDGFFLNLNSSGTAVLCDSYIGGGGTDLATGIALKEAGASRDTYIVGAAGSGTGFPVLTSGTYYQPLSAGGRDGFIMKLDAANSNQWCTLFGGSAEDFFTDVALRPSNHNPVVVGGTRTTTISSSLCSSPSGGGLPFCDNGGLFYSQSYGGGGDDNIIVEFDNSSQQLVWSTFFGGGGEELIDIDLDQKCPSVAINSNENVYLASHTNDPFTIFNSANAGSYNQPFNAASAFSNAFVARFDMNRQQTWTTFFGGLAGNFSHGICIDPSNNVFISGVVNVSSVQIPADYCTIATGGDYPLCNYSGLSYLETNTTMYRMSLIAFSEQDNILWSTLFGQDAYTYGLGVSATTDKLFLAGKANTSNTLWDFDSGSILDYYKTTNPTNVDASIARFDITSIVSGIGENMRENSSLNIFPNPSSNFITIELTELLKSNYELLITDVMGKTVFRKKYDKTEKSVKFDIQEYSNGVYFIHVNSEETQANGKFIKIK